MTALARLLALSWRPSFVYYVLGGTMIGLGVCCQLGWLGAP